MTNQCVMREVHRKIPVPIGICTRPKNFQSVIARCTTRQRRAPWQLRDVHPSAATSLDCHGPRRFSRRRPRNDESMSYASGSSKDPSSHRNLHTAKELPKRHCEVHDATASCAVASQGRSSIRGKPETFVHPRPRPSIAAVFAAVASKTSQ